MPCGQFLYGRGIPGETHYPGLAFLCASDPVVCYYSVLTTYSLQVSHVCIKDYDQISEWHLVGEMETAGMLWDGDPVYGAYCCMLCPPPVDHRHGFIEWHALRDVLRHLKEE